MSRSGSGSCESAPLRRPAARRLRVLVPAPSRRPGRLGPTADSDSEARRRRAHELILNKNRDSQSRWQIRVGLRLGRRSRPSVTIRRLAGLQLAGYHPMIAGTGTVDRHCRDSTQ
jgi:hypothetical protein